MASNQADLAASITKLETVVTQLGTDLQTGITELQAQLAAGVDTAPSIARLSTVADKLASFDAEIVAAEAPATPPPVTPVS